LRGAGGKEEKKKRKGRGEKRRGKEIHALLWLMPGSKLAT